MVTKAYEAQMTLVKFTQKQLGQLQRIHQSALAAQGGAGWELWDGMFDLTAVGGAVPKFLSVV